MKHLHFVQSLEPLQGGGLGRAALELHLEFLKLGAASRLVATRSRAFVESWPGCTQHRRLGRQKPFYARALHRRAPALVAEADVIHGHGLYMATNWLIGGQVRKQRKALVYHVHGLFEPWILNRSKGKKRLAHWLFENANFRHAGLWRALTMTEADQIRAQGIRGPIVVAPNGIDLTPFSLPAKAEADRDRLRLLFLGRIHPKKGLDLLVPAWGQLAQTFRDWDLYIAGPDEGGYKSGIASLARQLHVRSSVHFLDTVVGDQKVVLLQSADVFVLPSYSEGFAVAILEAMACRLPVVATTACHFPELATEGGGWECDPTVASLGRALRAALSASGSERVHRGEAGRRLVEKRFTSAIIARTVLDACEQHFA